MNLPPQIQAQTIAQAVFLATGIQPDVIVSPGKNPLITFNLENRKKMQAFLRAQMQKKSTIDIDFFPVVTPIVGEKLLVPFLCYTAGIFLAAYLMGQAH